MAPVNPLSENVSMDVLINKDLQWLIYVIEGGN